MSWLFAVIIVALGLAATYAIGTFVTLLVDSQPPTVLTLDERIMRFFLGTMITIFLGLIAGAVLVVHSAFP